jgi:cytochrome c-type biogenesis protein CcmI
VSDFYLYAGLLIAVSALFVVVPLLQKAKLNKIQVSNANVVKQRIAELDQEVNEGLISEKDKLSAVRELKLALVEESERITDNAIEPVSKVNWLLVSALSLPAVLLGIWVYIDSNQLDGLQQYIAAQAQAAELTERIQGQTGAEVTPNDYAKFALVIRKRLRETPDDVEGWRLLGQVQLSIGQMEESVAAFEKAIDLEPRNLDLREKYAQALMASGTEESLGNAKRQVEYLVRVAPDNRDYRLLLTVVATQLGDVDTALSNFMTIREQLSANSNFYQSLVAQLINIGAPAEVLNAPFEGAGELSTPASQIPDLQAAQNSNNKVVVTEDNESAGATGISLEISLAQSLVSKLPSTGFLIVFAQDANTDSRVPLAVKRMSLTNFPITVELKEEDAMMPSMTLANAESVRITARISEDADVMPTPGELQGQIDKLQLVKGSVQMHQLEIDKEIM